MGSNSLNTHGISKRVIYSESVIKMLQHGIEKLNFSDGPFLVLYILTNNQTLMGSSSLNMRCVFIKVIYSESEKHILQHGSEIFDF